MDCDKTLQDKISSQPCANISETEEQHNRNDNNGIDIGDDGGEAPNYSDDCKQPQNVDPTIGHPSASRTTKVWQSHYI